MPALATVNLRVSPRFLVNEKSMERRPKNKDHEGVM
jgi:hypothetical protein